MDFEKLQRPKRRPDTGRFQISLKVKRVTDGQVISYRRDAVEQTEEGAWEEKKALALAIYYGHYDPRKEVEVRKAKERKMKIPTFADFAKDFMEDYAATHNKSSTLREKDKIIRVHLLPAFGKKRLDHITTKDVDSFVRSILKKKNRYGKPISKKTARNVQTVFHKMLEVARRWGMIEQVPEFEWLKTPKPKKEHLTSTESVAMLNQLEGIQRRMVLFSLRTGLRMGELLALRWMDVHLQEEDQKPHIHVRHAFSEGKFGEPKTESSKRKIFLAPDALEATMEQHAETRFREETDFVFSHGNGQPFTKDMIKRIVPNALEAAGIVKSKGSCGWHLLRHSFTADQIRQGVNQYTIAVQLGHTKTEVTDQYSHVDDEVLMEAVANLGGCTSGVRRGHLRLITNEDH